MPTYVALLRGINVGRANRLSMPDLRAVFESLGHTDVRHYIQSGNVVFTTSSRSAAQVAAAIEQRLATDHGVTSPVILRTPRQLDAVVAGNPFLEAGAPEAEQHVTFLGKAPTAATARALREAVDAAAIEPEQVALVGAELYLWMPDGLGRARLQFPMVDRTLDTPTTTRNWRTVTTLAAMAHDAP